jgi:DNA repair exonuclease SbcCD ATPase subunit
METPNYEPDWVALAEIQSHAITELRAKIREMEDVFRNSAEKSFTPPPPGTNLIPVLQDKIKELESKLAEYDEHHMEENYAKMQVTALQSKLEEQTAENLEITKLNMQQAQVIAEQKATIVKLEQERDQWKDEAYATKQLYSQYRREAREQFKSDSEEIERLKKALE